MPNRLSIESENPSVFIPGIGLVSKTSDLYRQGQDLSRRESCGPLFADTFNPENGLLAPTLTEGILNVGPVLDLCCGDGYNLEKLAEIHTQAFSVQYATSDRTYELVGVDIDTAAAKERLSKRTHRFDVNFSFIQADIFDFFAWAAQENAPGVYKLITCTAMGEIITNKISGYVVEGLTKRQDAFFQSVKKLLAPGGLFYFPEGKEYQSALEKNNFQPEPNSGYLFWTVK